MKVAVVAGFAPSLIGFRGPLLRALVAQGHEVFACAAEEDVAVVETLRGWGIVYQALPLQRAGLNPLSDRRFHHALRSWLAKVGPDVVLSYTHKPVIYSALAAGASLGSPRVYPLISGLGFAFIGSGLKAHLAKWVMTMLYRWVSQYFSGVFFQNPDDLALFRKLRLIRPEAPVCIVRGSGIDLDDFPFTPLVPNSELRAPKFLLIARLLGDKGIREYVAAAKVIKSHHSKAEFHLVGPTDLNPAAISIVEVKRWQSEGTIIYHGSQADVRLFLHDCTVYVLPSYREGTPRTVLEAMATGRAVITTDAPGCQETIFEAKDTDSDGVRQGLNGFLVPVKSVDSLVVAMEQFINKPELSVTMGREGRHLAEAYYDVHKVNQQMLEFMGLAAKPPVKGES